MKRLLLSCLLILPLGTVSAATYVCEVARTSADWTWTGQHGYLTVALYTGPNCTGSPYYVRHFCSVGQNATWSGCAKSAFGGDLTEAGIASLMETLQAAAYAGRQVYGDEVHCNGAGGADPKSCWSRVKFSAKQ